jgi:hypothetical protein
MFRSGGNPATRALPGNRQSVAIDQDGTRHGPLDGDLRLIAFEQRFPGTFGAL